MHSLSVVMYLLLALAGTPSSAQEVSPPPPPPQEPEPVAAPEPSATPADPCAGEHANDPGCPGHEGTTSGAGVNVGHIPVPQVPVRSGGSSSGGLGKIDGEAFLALAVVAVVIAPLIVYAVDDPAEQADLDRWAAPGARIDLIGGTVARPSTGEWLGVFGARASGGYGSLGLDASVESAALFAQYSAADAHLLIRPAPRLHIEGAIALGARRVSADGRVREGFEFSMPHRYIFLRNGPQSFGIELRPGFFVGPQGMDFRLETALVVPLGRIASLSGGARAYSFDKDVRFGFTGALSATF